MFFAKENTSIKTESVLRSQQQEMLNIFKVTMTGTKLNSINVMKPPSCHTNPSVYKRNEPQCADSCNLLQQEKISIFTKEINDKLER